ncbi:hypothetical protein PFFVO_03689, partial [Plasmodium falciparum Vietnam Oak-Knoll (FVO)]
MAASTTYSSAKDFLDQIGQKVYDEVKNGEAKTYKDELEGKLSFASIFVGETVSSLHPCGLDYTKRLKGKRYPCANRQTVRFSDEYGGQCTHNRIKDNKSDDNTCGACAPYRRLHLCDYNLEKMGRTSTTKHDLLAEVCMAAKYEGDSIKTHYPKYEIQYPGSGSSFTLCTMLARSFADIGDIVRGKDLYLGYDDKEKNRRKQLDDKLKDIFAKIYDNLMEDLTNDQTKKDGAQKRYNGDGDNFFKLREDWWTANRHTVWKAITCHAGESDKYFRNTCAGEQRTKGYCRCDGDQPGQDKPNTDPPTYFDYVPQYLRWFEEWAEEFCTKRKHKLQNAITNCRDYAQNLYCSGNGYNCKETIRAENKLVEGDDCHKCSVSCKPFVKWIDNQKLEFEKQKKKYAEEIKKADGKNGTTTTITTTHGTINNMYVGDFYKTLQDKYRSVDDFLELLSKETTCKEHPEVEVKGVKARSVDFNNHEDNETFCRTEYCKPCPLCGLGMQEPPWNPKKDTDCEDRGIKTFDDRNSTPINLLVKDVTGTSIVEKLGGLCGNGAKKNIQTWKCRFESSQNYYCVLQNDKKNTPQQEIESFNSLFWHWITEMLKDSIDWRKEHENCINNNNTCKKGCKSKCECFEKWVKRMKEEWKQVLEVYDKQPDFKEVFTPYFTLGYLLKEYFTKIKAPYEEVESVQEFIKEMEQIIDENSNNINATKENNSITKFLQHEEGIATECKKTHNEEKCKKQKQQQQKQPTGDRGRSETFTTGGPRPAPPGPTAGDAEEIDEDEEEEEEEEEEDDDDAGGGSDVGAEEKAKKEGPEQGSPPKEEVNLCEIVDKLFSNVENLKQACQQKYDGKYYGWKCVTPSGEKSGDTGGSICVPPRRRRLYVGKLQEWADNSGNDTAVGGVTQPQPQGDAASTSSLTDATHLRDAFIQSAAVETFFLWDRYKKENTKTQSESPQAPQQP